MTASLVEQKFAPAGAETWRSSGWDNRELGARATRPPRWNDDVNHTNPVMANWPGTRVSTDSDELGRYHQYVARMYADGTLGDEA